jgi:hypothetical protein
MRKRKSKPKEDSSYATGWERTGYNAFNIKHNDGSVFECKIDDPRKFNAMPGLKNRDGVPKAFSGIGEKKPLVCDHCKQRVYKVTYKNSQSLCKDCFYIKL